MFCEQCGKKLEEDAKFCPQCGTKVEMDSSEETGDIDQETTSDESAKIRLSKKKKLISIIGICAVVLAIAAAAVFHQTPKAAKQNEDAAAAGQSEANIGTSKTAGKQAEKKKNKNLPEVKYYAHILKEYQEAEANGFRGEPNQYLNVNNLLLEGYLDGGPLYYSLVDLCKDGTPELIIAQLVGGDSDEYYILDIYGYADGIAQKLVFLDEFYPRPLGKEIGERDRFYICQNHMIKEEASGGADMNIVTYYKLGKGTVELEYKQSASQDGNDYSKSVSPYEGESSTKEEYEAICKKHAVKKDLQWHKISDLKIDLRTWKGAFASEQEAYDYILKQYRDYREMVVNSFPVYEGNYQNMNWNLFYEMEGSQGALSYTKTDLDQNGVPELIIADASSAEDYKIYDIYTYADGIPQRLFNVDKMGTEEFYYLCEGGYIAKQIQQLDADVFGNIFYRLQPNTAYMKYIDGLWTYMNDEVYARGESEEADDFHDIGEDEFEQIQNKYQMDYDIAWELI